MGVETNSGRTRLVIRHGLQRRPIANGCGNPDGLYLHEVLEGFKGDP